MMIRTTDLLELAQAAIKFAKAAADAVQHKEQLTDAYAAWRSSEGKWGIHITRNDENWDAMMVATAEKYRLLQNAKGRERRAKAKLLVLAGKGGA
ncbi:hypothetical protein [Simplicispira psychrophila]|uniref:hypothetical protein n=1 Tax=Simplicispira psychrophila TaxID=80882 RepID=UPI0004822E97|nr:hypothetical protein [Simplicispira psychrophila]